ncbi:hypothetical protein [Dinghuibacter silviterrae]|uniref:AhpC/TSA family protein n=1 Tax=Dinghuibacter silviterrae TaxID=1539049 RepID=A0A4R8DRN1_9BACT|nr:hypothetical protein [Dinghuibacter silviterrae]TDX00496.1 hypothetical protein EDB95_1521 [Dinghuibacter silviterrae]
MKIALTYAAIILLAGFDGLLLVKNAKADKQAIETKSQLDEDRSDNNTLLFDVSELTKYDSLTYKSDDYQLDGDLELKGLDGKSVRLKSLLKSGPKLIFRYSEINCNVCYQKVLDELSALIKKIGPQNILIITSYYNQRELYNFMRVNNISQNVFNIGTASLGLPIEKYDVPFLFMADQSLKTKVLFVPYKRNPGLTKQYFLSVKERYFSES